MRHLGDPKALLIDARPIFADHHSSLENGRRPVNLNGALLIGIIANLLKAGEQHLAVIEQLVELQGEFNFHLVYIVNRETQEVADGEGLASELIVVVLILQFLLPEVGLREGVLIIALRTVDVEVADVAPLTDFDIHGIVESGQNISHFALGQEEYLCNLFSLSVYVLVLMSVDGSEQIYYPCKEYRYLALEKGNSFISVTMDRH